MQTGLADDTDALVDVVLAAELPEDAMWAMLMATQREMVRMAMERSDRFMARDPRFGVGP